MLIELSVLGHYLPSFCRQVCVPFDTSIQYHSLEAVLREFEEQSLNIRGPGACPQEIL